jgi:hypothetical protein
MSSIVKTNAFRIFAGVYLILFLFSFNNGFFWDTTHLSAAQAWWYYDHDFKYFFLPSEIDSGHPTLFPLLLALVWKVFGPGLLISHLLMLPFIGILIVNLIEFSGHYFKNNRFRIAALVLLNPMLLGHSTLVSPDILLLSFFFLALNGIIGNAIWKSSIAIAILASLSMRGMMSCAVLFSFFAYLSFKSPRFWIKSIQIFLPGFLLAVGFLIFHFLHTGWIGYFAGSSWAGSFDRVDFKGWFRNVLVFGFRMADMGNIFIWIIIGGAIIWGSAGKITFTKKNFELFFLVVLSLVILVLPQFFFRQLLMHRYLLPFIILSIFFICSLAERTIAILKFKKLLIFTLLGLSTGNFWVYPDKIAKGWDCTLAHLPYYHLRKEALAYIKERNIPLNRVSAGFPYNLPSKYIDLTADTTSFSRLPVEQSPYVLYSNISNDYTNEQLRNFDKEWAVIKTFGKWPVRFVLYKNPSGSIK